MIETDKLRHGLLNEYSKLFIDLKDKPIKLLELGVFKGGSLSFWNDYFKNAKIIGFDSRTIFDFIRTTNIIIFKGDQAKEQDLRDVGERYGQFDIIIDDCSHRLDLTTLSLFTLWDYLKKGGYYIVEDWIAGLTIGKHYTGLEQIAAIGRRKSGNCKLLVNDKQGSLVIFRKP